jgi:dehydrogenase/reductase SDR family member 1
VATAVVTGASRGVGRGVATALAASGYIVHATGRTIAAADLPSSIIRHRCDHQNDADTDAVFTAVAAAGDGLDVLVNSAWAGYERMVENGAFTWGLPFWNQPAHRWTSMIDAGLRAAFVCSAHAARLMVPQKRGLIVNISHWAAQKRIGNAIYGIAKAATDKLTADIAQELRPHGVAAVSLYPGLVRTEAVLAAAAGGWFDLSNSESPQFSGYVIAALAADPRILERSGQVIVGADAALAYGIADADGKQPRPLTLADV